MARCSAGDDDVFNSRAVHATEMPAANGITTARSLARMYAATVGRSTASASSTTTPCARIGRSGQRPDAILVFPSQFGMGFMLHGSLTPMFGPTSFGHAGAGGSLGYADAEARIGYGYVMNQMASGIAGDPRTINLTEAVRSCI
jgi:CubicO group peptidase (beta-lactamase class C family)